MNLTRVTHYIPTKLVLSLCLMLLLCGSAKAFDTNVYAPASALSSGKWVKISVNSTGLYTIPASTLRSWGFSNPSAVRVHGYGGNQLSDVLSESDYVDDVPLVQSVNTDSGVTFYAVGPESWTQQSLGTSSMWIQSLNNYSTAGYYYLTENAGTPLREIPVGGSAPYDGVSVNTTFTESLFHESDLVSPGQTGRMLVGEDFRYNRTQTFNFNLPGKVAGTNVYMECSFLSKTYASKALLSFTANGTILAKTSTDEISTTNTKSYYHGIFGRTRKIFKLDTENLALGVTYAVSGVTNAANLNYLTINYTRDIRLDAGGKLAFRAPSAAVKLTGAFDGTTVWDVTDPLNITAMRLHDSDGGKEWMNEFNGQRNYAAWNPGASLPCPTYVGKVSNQNLHAMPTPDMVIFTTSELMTQAKRVADLHRNDPVYPLSVEIVEQSLVFNEFASGSADVNAFRRMLKMLYDRGGKGEFSGLRYALFMGRGFHDNRRLTAAAKSIGRNVMPIWQTPNSIDDNESYTTDDILGFLEDGSGLNKNNDILSIAVGRIPASTVQDAKDAVDKLYEYNSSMAKTAWKNQILLLADDEDNGQHLRQTEAVWEAMSENEYNSDFMFTKVYIDAFERRNGGYPEARDAMYRKLNEGVMWWNYIGHANMNSMTGENMVTFTDMKTLYLKQYPILLATTCDLLRWDHANRSGAEVMYFLPGGGTIATISATRPAFISSNGPLAKAIGSILPVRDSNGRHLPIGEIYRRGKNLLTGDSNKLRYVLMGDPAMRTAMPSGTVALESIDGVSLDDNDQLVIKAHSNVVLTGAVYDSFGNKMEDFNGNVSVVMYDAEKSTVSKGNGAEGSEEPFEEQGSLLYSGRTTVTGGEFSIRVAMPMEIANNFRPAALNMYAYSTVAGDTREAIGCNRSFYVYGYDEDSDDDTTPPVISQLVLNHSTFKPGDNVNETPMLMATVSDNNGINLSTAGIGHQMTITIDGTKTYSDVSRYYTPDVDQDRVSGSIAYPMDELTAGNHTLRLRVWDTSGNMAESNIDFYVVPGMAPKIYDIYCDANPATTEANFYLVHDRPDATLSVTVSVYNLLGRKVWEDTVKGRSDMFTTTPVTWNLTDDSGSKVGRGIYLYRAIVTADGVQSDTGTRKIAVAPQ